MNMNGILIKQSKDVVGIMNKLSGNETKLLFVLAQNSRDNIIDLNRCERGILEAAGISYKTFQRLSTNLVKSKVLVKTGVQRVLFIDPSFIMNGHSKHIMMAAADIEQSKKYWLEEATSRRDDRDSKIKAAYGDETLLAHFERKRVAQNDMSDDEIIESVVPE